MILQANGIQKKVSVAILAEDKIDFKPEKGYKRQIWTLYKGENPSRQHNIFSYIYICSQIRSRKIYKAIINRTKVRNSQ